MPAATVISVLSRPGTQRVVPRGRQSRRRELLGYALVAPALLLSVLIVVVPGALTLLYAFTDWTGISFKVNFVGLQNFNAILKDPVFATALGNNVKWLAIFLTLPAIVGLLVATLLLRCRRMRSFFQVIYLMPYVLAPVVNALVWQSIIYNPNGGVFGALGLRSPIGNTAGSLYGAAAVDMWHYFGFAIVVYFGAMRQTPLDQVEAAILDGCNGWGVFRYVHFPNIRSTVMLLGVMTVIFSFLAFDYIYLLTQGGPAHSSEVMGTYSYAFAFASFEFGKAAAVGLVMSLFGLAASCVYTWLSRKDIEA